VWVESCRLKVDLSWYIYACLLVSLSLMCNIRCRGMWVCPPSTCVVLRGHAFLVVLLLSVWGWRAGALCCLAVAESGNCAPVPDLHQSVTLLDVLGLQLGSIPRTAKKQVAC